MCTVSYIPQANAGYILTSNRDESLFRPAALPVMQYSVAGKLVYFPKDQKAGGTWIATDGSFKTVCLLNGGFEPHDLSSGKTYRKSRGMVVLEVFDFETTEIFAESYDFSDIEPFTLILVEQVNELKLTEIRWDGVILHVNQLDETIPRIWSSVTLYPPEVREDRERLFGDWISTGKTSDQEEIMEFHRWAGDGDERFNLVMKQGVKQTVSICSISFGTGITETIYLDLIADNRSKQLIYQV